MKWLRVVKIRSRESSPVQSYSAAKRVQVFLGLVPAGCLIIWEEGEGVKVCIGDGRLTVRMSTHWRIQEWESSALHVRPWCLKPSHASGEKMGCVKERIVWCFSRKKNSSSHDVRFFSLPIFKAVRADTYGLAGIRELNVKPEQRFCALVAWASDRRCYTDPRRQQLIGACHGFHSRWRAKTSYPLGLEIVTIASVHSGQLVFITCMIK
jgi:hypothetical protein